MSRPYRKEVAHLVEWSERPAPPLVSHKGFDPFLGEDQHRDEYVRIRPYLILEEPVQVVHPTRQRYSGEEA